MKGEMLKLIFSGLTAPAQRRGANECTPPPPPPPPLISTADFIAKYQETLIITNTLLPWMNSPVTFNDVIVDLPHQSPIHHLWLINISSDESLIMRLLWNTSSNLMSLMRPPLENHLAKAREAAGPLVAPTLTPLLRTCQSALRMQLPPPPSTFSTGIQMCFLMQTR